MPGASDLLEAEAHRHVAAGDWAALWRLLGTRERLPTPLALAAAQAAWGTGRYDEALSRFAAAAAAEPASADAALRLAQAEISLGRVDAARATLEAAAARLGKVPALALLAGQLALDRAGAEAALPWFEAAADDPAFGEAEVSLAALRVLAGLDPPHAREFGRPRADARWRSTLWQRERIPPARLVGTAAALLEHAVAAARVPGLVLEFGVYFGRSIRRLPAGADGLVHGFDSFEGLPTDWTERTGRGALSTGGTLPPLPPEVRLHVGDFAATLPAFLAAHPGPVRLAHIDCDLYASTATVLEHLAPRLVPGSVLLFDDLLGYPGYERHEFRAWHEFAAQRGVGCRWLGFTLAGREAALAID